MALSHTARGLVLGGVALACLVGGVAGRKLYGGRQPEGLVLYGNVDIRQVDLGFRVGGRIASVLVDGGDAVAEGQPLARLDTDMPRQQRDQAAASLDGQ